MVTIPSLKMVIWGMVYYCFTHIYSNGKFTLFCIFLGLSQRLRDGPPLDASVETALRSFRSPPWQEGNPLPTGITGLKRPPLKPRVLPIKGGSRLVSHNQVWDGMELL